MDTPDQQPSSALHRRIKQSTGLFLAALLLVAPCAWGVLAFTAAPREAGREFVNALREGEYERAFDRCSVELQEHLGSPDELERQTTAELLPESWWWTSSERRGHEATLKSSMKSWWGSSSLSVRLRVDGDTWRVERMSAATSDGRMELAVPRQ